MKEIQDAQEADGHTWKKFLNCPELVRQMLAYCDVGDLQYRVCCVGAQYFSTGDVALDILRKCDAVISGSTALHILLPECGTSWTPRDLDIYVSQANSAMLLHHVSLQGACTPTWSSSPMAVAA